ncbi:hypothetical protein D3C87_812710 [compost metagenome]
MTAFVLAQGLDSVYRFFEALPDIAEQAAVLAVNDVAERQGITEMRKEMRKEVAFPKGYLEGERLQVVKKARKGDISAMIRGRDRATSLARFAEGQNPENTRGRGVRVRVNPGQTRLMPKAFMVRLKNGNLGVAVRLQPGDQLRNSSKAVKLKDNTYLLYGPSVDQVFRGVAEDQTPQIQRLLTTQFLRQFARLSRG